VGDVVVRSLEDRTGSVLTLLRQRSEDLTRALARSTDSFTTTIEEGAGRSVARLVETSEVLSSELAAALGNLAQTNELLQRLVAGAGQNLSSLDRALSERMRALQETLAAITAETGSASARVAEQVEALKTVSTGTMRDAATLIYKLDEQGRLLASTTDQQTRALTDAAGLLEDVEKRVGHMLDERRSVIEGAVSAIGHRSEDLQSITQSFVSLVDEALEKAEMRTRNVGSVLADCAQSTAAALYEQFDQLKTATAQERELTAAALRAAYEQTTREMSAALAHATDGFREAASQMRHVSGDIRQELESTRTELQKSIIDLPRETRDQAGAMRRVVAEQIKALNELSDIVARSGRSLDVVQPEPDVSRRMNRAQMETTAPSPLPQAAYPAAAPVYQAQEPIPAPMPPAPAARGPAAAARPARSPTPPAPRGPAQATPARDAAPAREPQRLPRGGGWLSELLARASRDDDASGGADSKAPAKADIPAPKPPMAPAMESLGSLSVDIARMVDQEAIVELWERYYAGERNVFSRRLYTLQGQERFDEFRRRFRRDPDFRIMVESYVSKFEELLEEVTPGERSAALTKAVLVSDEGKVYTMLAHASGRFD
jgi:hypothetical protein